MEENNLKNNIPSEAISSVINDLSKEGKPAKRKYSRRKRTAKQAYRPKEVAVDLPEIPAEEKKNGVWLTTVANLALLIAIFTIIFAAHRAIQNSKHASNVTAPAAPTEAVTAPETQNNEDQTVAAAPAEEEVEENTKDTAVANDNPPENEVKEELADAPATKTTKKQVTTSKYYPDPYTDGGPMDLDRRTPSTAKIDKNTYTELNSSYTYTRANDPRHDYSPTHNPWNAGGHMDLDNENVRQDYIKKSYISSTESDTKK